MNDAKVGRCKLCGQELILTDDDCWHPASLPIACPSEPSEMTDLIAWFNAGNRTGRPGRENWEPA